MTRFDLDMDGSMEPSEYGHWVRYEDAQRTWVGLTQDEFRDFASTYEYGTGGLIRAIEAKLKEKNK